jgi:hypothetical protein
MSVRRSPGAPFASPPTPVTARHTSGSSCLRSAGAPGAGVCSDPRAIGGLLLGRRRSGRTVQEAKRRPGSDRPSGSGPDDDANAARAPVTEKAAYGWDAFDQERVPAIRHRRADAVDMSGASGMHCPLKDHDEWLPWEDGSAPNGTILHGDPEVRFHGSPTYVLYEPMGNFIAGHRLIQEALDGRWEKAETHRLGHENSEDALTWNVFRSLQEAGQLRSVVELFAGITPAEEPELYLWGRRIGISESCHWDGLAAALELIERWPGQKPEPDCCIRLPGEALILIEAKFGSPTATKHSDAERDRWFKRYDGTCPGLFNRAAISATPARSFPEQLLRNAALASQMRQPGEQVTVVALTRASDQTSADVVARGCLREGSGVDVRRATWEGIHGALSPQADLDPLRHYLEHKSFRLERAFALPSA